MATPRRGTRKRGRVPRAPYTDVELIAGAKRLYHQIGVMLGHYAAAAGKPEDSFQDVPDADLVPGLHQILWQRADGVAGRPPAFDAVERFLDVTTDRRGLAEILATLAANLACTAEAESVWQSAAGETDGFVEWHIRRAEICRGDGKTLSRPRVRGELARRGKSDLGRAFSLFKVLASGAQCEPTAPRSKKAATGTLRVMLTSALDLARRVYPAR